MNWLQKITQKSMPLDPDAYLYEPNPHRLQEHQETHATPYGRIPNPQDPQNIKDLYKGVHATEDFDWAAAYANNRAAVGDPPVVIEFTTTQGWITDVDALKDITDQLAFATEQVMEIEGLKEHVASGRVDKAYLAEVFEEVSGIQDADFYVEQHEYDSTIGDEIQSRAARITADNITDFFQTYYPEDPVTAFYEGYLQPVIMGGKIDQRLYGHFHNQMRFMEAIRDDEIVRVYKIMPWEDQVYNEYDDEDNPDEEYLEERETDGVRRQLVNQDEVMYFSPQKQVIWESSGQKPGATFYHGTSLSRAQNALPFLRGVS